MTRDVRAYRDRRAMRSGRGAFVLACVLRCSAPALSPSDVPKLSFASQVAGRSCRSSDTCAYFCFARDQGLASGAEAEGVCDLAQRGERKVVENGKVARVVIVN